LDELELTELLRPYGVVIPGGTSLLTAELIGMKDNHIVSIEQGVPETALLVHTSDTENLHIFFPAGVLFFCR